MNLNLDTPLGKNVLKFRLTTHRDEKKVNDTLNEVEESI